MLNVFRPFLIALAAAAVVLPAVAQDAATPPPAAAPAPMQAPPPRIEVRSQREDAGARVRQVERAGGRVLQAEPMQRGGREVYRFKVLTPEGRVRVTQGDPRDAGTDPFRDNPAERRRDQQLGFDRQTELTSRRREFGDDARTDGTREHGSRQEMRPPEAPPPTAAGDRAGD